MTIPTPAQIKVPCHAVKGKATCSRKGRHDRHIDAKRNECWTDTKDGESR